MDAPRLRSVGAAQPGLRGSARHRGQAGALMLSFAFKQGNLAGLAGDGLETDFAKGNREPAEGVRPVAKLRIFGGRHRQPRADACETQAASGRGQEERAVLSTMAAVAPEVRAEYLQLCRSFLGAQLWF